MSVDRQKVVIILGAGATLAYLPSLSTEALCGQLFDRKAWDRLLREFGRIRTSTAHDSARATGGNAQRANIALEDIMTVLEFIRRRLQPLKKFSAGDFDTVLHLCDKLAAKLSTTDSDVQNIDAVLLDATAESLLLSGKTERGGWYYVPYLCRELIAQSILDAWDGEPGARAKAISDYRAFLQAVRTKFGSLSVYSFNYDPLMVEAQKRVGALVTGFDADQPFNGAEFFEAQNVLAHMHGHLGFVPIGMNVMRYTEDYRAAHQQRLHALACAEFPDREPFGIGSKGNHYDTYMVTGLDKIGAFTVNPFAAYLTRAVRDIGESSHILLIGASLNDYYFMSLLRNVFVDRQRQVIAVNKYDIHKDDYRNDMVLKLLADFDPSHDIAKVTRRKAKAVALEQKAGWCQLADHVRLYYQGAEEFFTAFPQGLMTEIL